MIAKGVIGIEENRNESPILLQVEGVCKRFPGVQALKNVNLSVQTGKVHGLVGENGSGKSTLVKILYGQYRADDGRVRVEGKVVTIPNPHMAQKLGISYISQEITLVPMRSVAENVLMGRLDTNRCGVVNHSQMYLRVKDFMEFLEVDIDPRSVVRDLSVNMQQMVAVARALSVESKVIIMDEVTSALTDREVSVLFRIIRTLKAKGMSFIFITHRLKEVFQICDQVTVLRDGEKIADAHVDEINEDQLIKQMVGRSLGDYFHKEPVEIKGSQLRVENLTSPPLLKNINFEVRSGEILGLAGLVGSGRSELALSVVGRNPITKGKIIIRDEEVVIRSPNDAFKKGLAFVPEDRKRQALVLPLPVKQNFSLSCLKMFSPISSFGFIKNREENRITNNYIERMQIKTPSLETQIQWLSGGNQQKVVLARWLVKKPMVFILDEPTRGIDVGAKSEIYRLMGEIVKSGSSIVMISSDLPEILGLSDRILVMFQGAIVKELSIEEANEEKIAFYATGQKDRR